MRRHRDETVAPFIGGRRSLPFLEYEGSQRSTVDASSVQAGRRRVQLEAGLSIVTEHDVRIFLIELRP
jgi:hypothetical protein